MLAPAKKTARTENDRPTEPRCPCGGALIEKLDGESLAPCLWCPDCERTWTLDLEPWPESEPCFWCRQPSGYDAEHGTQHTCARCECDAYDEWKADRDRPPTPREARLHRAIERGKARFKGEDLSLYDSDRDVRPSEMP